MIDGWDSTGSGGANTPRDTWQYNPATDTWTAKAAFTGSPRYTTTSFALNGKGYIACGFKPYVNDVYSYDPISDAWTPKSSFPGAARQAMNYFVIGSTLYAGTGASGDGNGSYFVQSDWYKYNDITDSGPA